MAKGRLHTFTHNSLDTFMRFWNLLKKETPIERFFRDDEHFNKLYSPHSRSLAGRHWTPVRIAKAATQFLSREDGKKILDIGSGVGKFCLCAAHFAPTCFYYGFEQRANLIEEAEKIKQRFGFSNIFFLNKNMTEINFNDYDYFYFFNSFYEQLEPDIKIDYEIEYSIELYNFYSDYLFEQLSNRPVNTKLCTYFARSSQVPPTYRLVSTQFDDNLKCWIKAE